MVLKDIMAISGQPGLFKFIAQGKNAIIVEHLETKKRSSAFTSARVSSLEEISIFTDEEDLPLGKVFDLIYENTNGGPAIDYKSDPEKLKTWFGEILPKYNREKVYVSDIKKVAQWYDLLHKLNLLVKEESEKPAEPAESAETAKPATKEVGAGKPVKKRSPAKKKEAATGKKAVSKEKSPASPKKKPSKPTGK
jgi:hypothetical protein